MYSANLVQAGSAIVKLSNQIDTQLTTVKKDDMSRIHLPNNLKLLTAGFGFHFRRKNDEIEVLSFFCSPQYLIPLYPDSIIMLGDTCTVVDMTDKDVRQEFSQVPEITDPFEAIWNANLEMREYHKEDLKLPVATRYANLNRTQPWVKMQVQPKYIASYLKISVGEYAIMEMEYERA